MSRLSIRFALVAVAFWGAIFVARGSAAQSGPPANDNFDRSRRASVAFSPPGDGYEDVTSTEGATLEDGEPTCVAEGGATVWYVYFPEMSADLTVDTTGSDFATFVAVYRITDFAPSPPGGSLEQIVCAGHAGAQANVSFTARTNQGGFAIQVGGVDAATGTLRLRIGCAAGCPPPNNDIVDAPGLVELPYIENGIDTTDADTEPGEPQPCGNIGKTVWYSFRTLEQTDSVSAIATSNEFAPVIAVYRLDYGVGASPPGALANVLCGAGATGDFFTQSFKTEPFTTYYVQFGGAEGAGGVMSVLLSCQRAPNQSPCSFRGDEVESPEAVPIIHEPETGGAGTIGGPDTGSGGYLPRR